MESFCCVGKDNTIIKINICDTLLNSHKRKLLINLLCFIKRDKVCPIPPAAPNTATLYCALCDSLDGPTPIRIEFCELNRIELNCCCLLLNDSTVKKRFACEFFVRKLFETKIQLPSTHMQAKGIKKISNNNTTDLIKIFILISFPHF